MHQPLLIEIGIEELPAIPFLRELPHLLSKWNALLQKYRMESPFELFYTPRRLVLLSQAFPLEQPELKEALFGPPLEIAFKEGAPTKAAESFAAKCGVSVSELGSATKEGKEVLFYSKTSAGESAKRLLPLMIEEWIASLNFGKSMRWGSLHENFIRPVRWLGIMHGENLIPATLFGISSQKLTYVHRIDSFEPQPYEDIASFLALLAQKGVILDPKVRREKILQEIRDIEEREGVSVELDTDLLEEVVAITEYPTALLGHFEARFLDLPPEVIITSMKENQRYFALYQGDKLYNGFIVVSNARSQNAKLIVQGNEKVLRARLSDALFFYQNDLKNGLLTERLQEVTFVEGLGSMAQKSERETKIALYLFDLYASKLFASSPKNQEELRTLMQEAATLAKADLMSETVYEFTELQGTIGYYLGKALGKDPLVYEALKEQYLPKGEDSELPSSPFSAILALAHRLDNLMGLFSLGRIPTGSKDPFALRRAASGVLRIVWKQKIPLDLSIVLPELAPLYKPFDLKELEGFILERIESLLSTNASFIRAVAMGGERNLLFVGEKIEALSALLSSSEGKSLSTTFKRVANITKGMDMSDLPEIKPEWLECEEEKRLFAEFNQVSQATHPSALEELSALLKLKEPLDQFFDHVLINCDNTLLKKNRQALIAHIYQAFLRIADIKEISL